MIQTIVLPFFHCNRTTSVPRVVLAFQSRSASFSMSANDCHHFQQRVRAAFDDFQTQPASKSLSTDANIILHRCLESKSHSKEGGGATRHHLSQAIIEGIESRTSRSVCFTLCRMSCVSSVGRNHFFASFCLFFSYQVVGWASVNSSPETRLCVSTVQKPVQSLSF